MATARTLLNNALLEPGFKEKLAEVCNKLQCKPEDLLKVMANESGIKPDAYNNNGGASGLIQFMPAIYKQYGVTGDQLRSMTRVQQLDYVYRYFRPYIGKLTSPGAIYSLTYLPGRFQKPLTPDKVSIPPGGKPFPTDSPVLASKYDITTRAGRNGSRISNADYYTANAGLDVNRDGYTTVADLTAVTNKKASEFGIVDGILSGVTPSDTVTTQTTTVATDNTSYIEKVYKNPFKNAPIEVQREVLYEKTIANNYFTNYLKNLVALDRPDMEGDLLLIDSIIKKQEKQTQETKNILDSKLGAFSPDAKLMLIASSLFEMYPDDMRNKMSINSARGGANPNYSHAWRTPGKVSVTADLTIPGIAGLRIGQVFWVDRISDSYKEYGAFQLFGLTENIDISKGWTTAIHSRFNVLPRNSGGGKYLVDSDTVEQITKTLAGITTTF